MDSSSRRVSFPQVPRGWYYLCPARELTPGPVRYELMGRTFVAFRGASGAPAVLDARCSHMRADLSLGCVRGGVLHCPLHDWRYDGSGRCAKIPALPASEPIPPFAKQIAYPATELGGHVVFFNAPVADFPMPFFDGRTPEELCPAEPFDIGLDCPWYLVGANGFDVQHFRIAHDRTLVDTPAVDNPSPRARRMIADYDVTGDSIRDAIIRKFAGPRVRMSVTSWAGVNIVVSATFQRTTTYGMVFVRPLPSERTLLRTIVWIARHGDGPVARWMIDPIAAAIRRKFIEEFLGDDAARSSGARYNPATLIDADRELREYLDWLHDISNSNSNRDGGPHDAEHGAVDRGVVSGCEGDVRTNDTAGDRSGRRGGGSDGGGSDPGDHAAAPGAD